jgi:cold shock CspA family protein
MPTIGTILLADVTGTVDNFDDQRGFGGIEPDIEDFETVRRHIPEFHRTVFVHRAFCTDAETANVLKPGVRVTFDIIQRARGASAGNLRLAGSNN